MCRPISWLSHIISAIGALNWGLVAFFKFNLVFYLATITNIPSLEVITYMVVGICGLISLVSLLIPKYSC